MIASLPELNLYYEYTPRSGRPVVCFAHCFAGDARFWDAQLPAMVDFGVLRYDARGHGRSESPAGPYTLAQMAGDVVALLNHLNIRKVHLVGVSMSGMVAQTVALTTPERLDSLVLVNTTCGYSDAQRALWKERADCVAAGGIEPFREALMSRWFTDEAARGPSDGYAYMSAALDRFSRESFVAAVAAVSSVDTEARLGEIKLPTLVVAAPEDPGIPRATSERLAAGIGGAQLHWLHPARHLATLEHPDTFNVLLTEFLLNRAPIR